MERYVNARLVRNELRCGNDPQFQINLETIWTNSLKWEKLRRIAAQPMELVDTSVSQAVARKGKKNCPAAYSWSFTERVTLVDEPSRYFFFYCGGLPYPDVPSRSQRVHARATITKEAVCACQRIWCSATFCSLASNLINYTSGSTTKNTQTDP